jgi:hypothetical protein
MTEDSADLKAALRAIPGVADAEVSDGFAEGVRIRLKADADATEVSGMVRDVLAGRGLRGKMAPPQDHVEPSGPPPPPAESAKILAGPGLVPTSLISAAAELAEAPPRPDVDVFIRSPEQVPVTMSPDPIPRLETEESTVTPGLPGELLAQVRVQEDRDGVAVTIEADGGRSVTRRGRPSDAGVQEAVVAAVGELSGDQPPPVLIKVTEHAMGERAVVTVLLQRHDGSFHVGSAMIGAEKAFALARAAWAALSQAG